MPFDSTPSVDTVVKTLSEKLLEAADFLEQHPESWCSASFARDAHDLSLSFGARMNQDDHERLAILTNAVKHPAAVRWCALGMLFRIGITCDEYVRLHASTHHNRILVVNDNKGRLPAIAAMREAAEHLK